MVIDFVLIMNLFCCATGDGIFLWKRYPERRRIERKSRMGNVWKTRTRLERGPRDVINSAKWLNLVRGNMVSMYEWRALPQRGEHYTRANQT